MAETLRRIVLASRPQGHPVADNFRLEEAPLPTPGEGEMLVRVLWLSLDPYMRGRMDDAKSYSAPVPVGGTMEGGTVGQVIASNNPKFAAGDFVLTHSGWCSHAVSDGKGVRKLDPALAPLQANLGVLGMPGLTAYAGLAEHGRPKAGETLVVGAATGAVGSMVGQLAKIQGLRAVGVAGGAEKCAFAVEQLGFDACIDHRAAPDAGALRAQIAAACPDGIDIYWENVGAETLVVGAATGAVGSMVGQLAKIQGLRAVGVAGGAEKCAFAVEELGFDACIDHRAAADARALRAQIAAACPDGIDIYWENVGAETLEAVVPLMNMFGRIPVCGMIAWYDLGGLGLGAPPPGPNLLPQVWRNILVKRLAVRGFIVTDHADRFRDFMAEVPGYIRDGRVRYRESVTEGLENSPAAFMAMLKGGNFGKTLVRVAD